jgi:hypothetical protein
MSRPPHHAAPPDAGHPLPPLVSPRDAAAAAPARSCALALPERAPDRLWGGVGSGHACDLCLHAIPPTQTEFELEFRGPLGAVPATYRLHSACFHAWDAARRLRLDDAAGAKSDLTSPAVARSFLRRDHGPAAGAG